MDTANNKENMKGEEQGQQTESTQTPLNEYAHKGKKIISERINALQSEWDVERTLLLNAAVVTLTGAFLGAFVNKKWFILSAVAGFILAEEAITGWSPPSALMKKLGKRSHDEIMRERYGLKAIKGDFKNVKDPEAVWNATE